MIRAGLRTASLLGAIVAVGSAGCSMARPHPVEGVLMPLAPAALGTSRSVQQVLYAAFGEHDLAFQCVVEAVSDHVTLVGLGAQGQRWFSLHYDGQRLESESQRNMPAMLDPRQVLVDLQLALWPLAAWQQALAGSDWQVSEPTPATRRLRRNGNLVAEVHYSGDDPWKGRLWLSNFELGYSLTVETQALP